MGILRYPSQIPVPLEHVKNETRLRIPVTLEHSRSKLIYCLLVLAMLGSPNYRCLKTSLSEVKPLRDGYLYACFTINKSGTPQLQVDITGVIIDSSASSLKV